MQPSLIKHEVPVNEIERKQSLGKAIEYCAELAGYSYDKTLEGALNDAGCKVDKTQLSRWQQGSEGIKWEKLIGLMDVCGNDAPLFWMLHARGYEIKSIRKRETELETKLRMAEEKIRELETKNETLVDAFRGKSK